MQVIDFAWEWLSGPGTDWGMMAERALIYVLGILLLYKLGHILYEQWRFSLVDMAEIDQMQAWEFKKHLTAMLNRRGLVEWAPATRGMPAGLIWYRGLERVLLHPAPSAEPLGAEIVAAALAVAQHHRCRRALVVTNHTFTSAARRKAAAHQVELWDRRALAKQILAMRTRLGRSGARRLVPFRRVEAPSHLLRVQTAGEEEARPSARVQ